MLVVISGRVHGQLSFLWLIALVISTLMIVSVSLSVFGPTQTAPYTPLNDNGKFIIHGLPYGGSAWKTGVRNGMVVESVSGNQNSSEWGTAYILNGNADTSSSSLSQDLSRPESTPLLLALALLLSSLLIRSFSSLPAWLLLFGSAAISSSLLVGRFAEPWSAACWLAPLLIASLALAEEARSRWRTGIMAALTLLSVLLVGIALRAEAPGGDAPDLLLVGPLAFGLLAYTLACAIGLYDALIRARERSGGSLQPVMVFNELVPGRNLARLAAIDEERDRLAMDLHDEVLPSLTALTRRLEGASPQAAADLRQVSQALRAQMGERRLVSLEAFGLETALRELVDKISGQVKPDAMVIELEAKAGSRASGHVEAAAYRIARQALANALEHAGASQISARLHEEAQAVSLVVADDGEGLRPAQIEEALRQGHLGLLEMRDRAAAVGGSLEIVSLGAKGTEVRFRWQA